MIPPCADNDTEANSCLDETMSGEEEEVLFELFTEVEIEK